MKIFNRIHFALKYKTLKRVIRSEGKVLVYHKGMVTYRTDPADWREVIPPGKYRATIPISTVDDDTEAKPAGKGPARRNQNIVLDPVTATLRATQDAQSATTRGESPE